MTQPRTKQHETTERPNGYRMIYDNYFARNDLRPCEPEDKDPRSGEAKAALAALLVAMHMDPDPPGNAEEARQRLFSAFGGQWHPTAAYVRKVLGAKI